MSSVAALRELLDRRFPDAAPVRYGTTGVVPMGVAAMDEALPAGGLPRGKLAAWSPGGGATAVLRAACGAVVGRGERAAWVDGAGSVVGAYWRRGPVLLRPPGRLEALECAESMLRSGGFALVVLALARERAGARLSETETLRLSRGVREGGGAFVVVAPVAGPAPLKLRSRIPPEGYVWRRGPFGEPVAVTAVTVAVRMDVMGRSRRARFTLPVRGHDLRLSLEPELVDRRGVRS